MAGYKIIIESNNDNGAIDWGLHFGNDTGSQDHNAEIGHIIGVIKEFVNTLNALSQSPLKSE